MALFHTTGRALNKAFWRATEMIGIGLKAAGLLAWLWSLVVIFGQTLDFFRQEQWLAEPLLPALPDSVVGWLISTASLAEIADPLLRFLYWVPLSLAIFLAGAFLFGIGKLLTPSS